MPVCEVLFEIADPVGARSAIINLFEGNQYKVQENTLRKIVAYHQLSLKKFGHKVEVEFDPATTQCILTTVMLRIDHSESLEYMRAVVNKLAKILPTMKITSVKPKISLDFKEAANVAKPETVHCEEIEKERSGWPCQYCGFENVLGLERCKKCGRLRRSVIEPEELEGEEPISEEGNDAADSEDVEDDEPVLD